MNSISYFFTVYVPYLIGGGRTKYRIRQTTQFSFRIERCGGGSGPFWCIGSLFDFDDLAVADRLMRKWANESGAKICAPARLDRKYHTHTTEEGLLVRCYHSSKNTMLSTSFWLGVTLSFPLEHYLYEKVWPFTLVTAWLGL